MKLSKKILGLAFGGVMSFCSLPCFNAMNNGATLPPLPDISVSWSNRYLNYGEYRDPGRGLRNMNALHWNDSYFRRAMDSRVGHQWFDEDWEKYPGACEFDIFLYTIQEHLPQVTNVIIDIFDRSVAHCPGVKGIGDRECGYICARVDGSTLYFYDATSNICGYQVRGFFGWRTVNRLKQLIKCLGQCAQ